MLIRVAIIDDHPMVLNGLKDMLSNFGHIVLTATYSDGDTLMAGLERDMPDVLLLDIQLPGKRGDELAPMIRKAYPNLRMLTLTNFDNMLYVDNMLQNGVLGYLLKNTDQETLVEAIETVHRGEVFLTPVLAEKLEHFRTQIKRKTSAKFVLTPREKDILRMIVDEHSSQEIADKLFLSMRTVENYRLNLSLKLEVKNTAGLVRKVIELGLLQ
jgi:DNA-binding NarL/FixJ family response regulator